MSGSLAAAQPVQGPSISDVAAVLDRLRRAQLQQQPQGAPVLPVWAGGQPPQAPSTSPLPVAAPQPPQSGGGRNGLAVFGIDPFEAAGWQRVADPQSSTPKNGLAVFGIDPRDLPAQTQRVTLPDWAIHDRPPQPSQPSAHARADWFDQLQDAPSQASGFSVERLLSQAAQGKVQAPSSGSSSGVTNSDWFDRLENAPGSRFDVERALTLASQGKLPASAKSSTTVLDSLQPVAAPTPGMAAKSGTSILDAQPAVHPTPGMLAADPFAAAGWQAVPDPQARQQQASLDRSSWTGVANAIPSGLYSGVASIANMPNRLWNLGAAGVQALGGPDLSVPMLVNENPTNYQPRGTAERVTYAGAQAVGSLPAMAVGGEVAAPLLSAGGEAAAAVPVAGRALQGAANAGATVARSFADMPLRNPVGMLPQSAFVGGAAGQAASEAVPDRYAPLVNMFANLAAGGGLAATETALGAGGRAAVRTLGAAGVGPKGYVLGANGEPLVGTDGQPLRVTATQRDAIAQRLANAAGPDLDTAQRALNFAPEQLVPGSQPTTAQVAPVPGLVGLEQAHRVAAPEPSNARAAAQNSARLGAIQGLAPENGRPASVGEFFRGQLDQIDQHGQQAIAAARSDVQRATSALGGFGAPSAYGEQARSLLEQANASAQAREQALWRAVDPDGTLALPAAAIRTSAQQILSQVNPAVGDALTSQESALLNGAASLPDVIRFGDLSSLRSNISTVQRSLAPTYGWDSRPLRRLGMLKGAVDDAISNAVDGRVTQETQAVASGMLPSDATILARLNAMSARGYAAEQSAANLGTGQLGGAGVVEASGGSATGQSGIHGAGGPSDGGFGSAAGNPGLQGQAQSPLTPNFNQDAADAYAAARHATLERKQTYRTGPVGRVLKPGPGGQDYAVPDANVVPQFLTGRPDEASRVAAFASAAGNGGHELMRDALVADLRRSGIVQADGTLKSSAAFADWQRRRADTIRQFAGLGDQFASARAAQNALNDATASHEAALANFQKSAAASFIKDDPMVAVRRAFGSSNPTETFQNIVAQVRGNADAEAGLKRAVVDYVLDRVTSTRAATETEDFLKADAFRRWLRPNAGALKKIFGGQGVQNLDAVAADMRRGAYSGVSAGGSPTATYANSVKRRNLVPGGHGGEAVATSMLAVLGEQLGEHVAGHGLIGAAALPAAGIAVHALRQAGVRTLNDLERLAMLHPNVGRELLARVGPDGRVSPVRQRRLAMAISAALGAGGLRQISGAPQSMQ